MEETAVVVFENENAGISVDIEVPIYISANDLIMALNDVYKLGIEPNDIFNGYLAAENPIAFLRGNKTLQEFGIHNATRIIYRRDK